MSERLSVVIRTDQGTYCQVPALRDAGLTHGFSCRDLGACENDPSRALGVALGIQDLRGAGLQQQHTAKAHAVGRGHHLPDPAPVGDALVSLEPGWRLTLRTADCLPLLFIDSASRTYAAVHAGWRGTLAGVVTAALELWKEKGVPDLSHAWMAIGPGIRQCCFEVGEEVVHQFRARFEPAHGWFRPGIRGKQHLDLAAANRHQAIAAGFSPDRILDPALCTSCRRDLFHSYRAEEGTTSRIITHAAVTQ